MSDNDNEPEELEGGGGDPETRKRRLEEYPIPSVSEAPIMKKGLYVSH
jgi:hypothetical protein